jgi:hypothetical protein
MKTFKRLAKDFTTWRNSQNALKEGLMNMAVINPHAQGITSTMLGSGVTTAVGTFPYAPNNGLNPTVTFSVERVDNGFILRSGRFQGDISKTKVCSSIEEVKDLFVAVLVEYQLEK